MRVTMYWHGGSGYAAPDLHSAQDAEVFDSMADAMRAFAARAHDRHYPCVMESPPEDGGPEAWVFIGKHSVGDEYPDRVIRFGPRGGVVVERA